MHALRTSLGVWVPSEVSIREKMRSELLWLIANKANEAMFQSGVHVTHDAM